MLPPDYEAILQAVETIPERMSEIDDQIQALVSEGMDRMNPLRYLALQPEIDRLIGEQHELQGEWSHAMTRFAIYKMAHSG